MRLRSLSLAACLGLTALAPASELIYHDGFDYADDASLQSSYETDFRFTGSPTLAVLGNGLSISGLQSSGAAIAPPNGDSGWPPKVAARLLPTPYDMPKDLNTYTFYLSCLVQVTSEVQYDTGFFGFGMMAGNVDYPHRDTLGLGIEYRDGAFVASATPKEWVRRATPGIDGNGATVPGLAINTTYLLLAKYTVTPKAASDKVSIDLSVFQEGDTLPSSEPVSWDASWSSGTTKYFDVWNVSVYNFDRVVVSGPAAKADHLVDEIRIATSFAEALATGSSGPGSISDLQAIALSHESVMLQWTDVSGESSYQVLRDGAEIATLPADSTSFTDTNLLPETSYEYTVNAIE